MMHESHGANRYARRSMRLRDYDYAQAGAYCVTVCTHQRSCTLGELAHDQMRVNSWGEVVAITWKNLPERFTHVTCDAFVVMPNHVHGIVVIDNQDLGRGEAADQLLRSVRRDSVSAASPLQRVAHGTATGGLGAIIQTFKSISTRRINATRHAPGTALWQRNYYERIIRDERELNAIRQYIINNPLQWALDIENPARAT